MNQNKLEIIEGLINMAPTRAAYLIARLYQTDFKDDKVAKMWFNVAARDGFSSATTELLIINKKRTPFDVMKLCWKSLFKSTSDFNDSNFTRTSNTTSSDEFYRKDLKKSLYVEVEKIQAAAKLDASCL